MDAEIQPTVRKFASNLPSWCKRTVSGLKQRSVRLRKRLLFKHLLPESVSVYAVVSAFGIIAGGVAGGLWLNSSAAGFLVLIVLFLLANIGRSLRHIGAQLGLHPAAPLHPSWPSTTKTTNQQNIYISTKAMERLRPWVEDQSSLTEESAKAYCSVLLDTLALVDPRLAGKARAKDIWS